MNRRVLLLLSLAGIVGGMIPGRFSVTLTPSVRHRLFFLDRDLSRIGHGDYVLFSLDAEHLRDVPLPAGVREGTTVRAIKRVACDEGETLRVEGSDFWCGGEYIGRAKERSRQGEPLAPFLFRGPVPAGQAFLAGEHPDSFDSRYFGFVEKSAFRARALPIL